MARWLSAIAVGALMLFPSAHVEGDDAEDFLHLLEARDRSIASFEIRLRRVHLRAKLEDYSVLKKTIEEAARRKEATDAEAGEWVEELVQARSDDPSWITEHIRQRGDCYKQIRTSGGGKHVDVEVYDGRLHYDYSQPNRQLDIHSTIPNVAHAGFQDIGLIGGEIRKWGRLASLEQDPERTRCIVVWSGDDSHPTTYEYGPGLGLRHVWYEYGSERRSDDYYLFHRDIAGYSIPRARISLYRNTRRNEYSLGIYAIEDVRINCPLADEDLYLGQLPDGALVIDYRFEPRRQWRYEEYRRAAANPDIVHAGRCRPEDLIDLLHGTSGERIAHATRNSRVGRPAPRLHVDEWLVKLPALSDWPPDRFTVLNFCSIECGFCLNEVPENKELAQWLEDQGALFLAIHSARAEPRPVIDFLDQYRIDYPVGLDEPTSQAGCWNSATFAEYGINGIPAYVTIAKDGRVLSYDRSPTRDQLRKLMATAPEESVQRGAGTQRPAVIPKAWLARDLAPQSQIAGRFFVFRPETPDLVLRRPESLDETVKCEWTRHSAAGQTVYEVRLTAKTLAWGQTLGGRVALIAQHNNMEEQVVIPYELHSEGLTECASPVVWFGCVSPGAAVTRPLPLRARSGHKIQVTEPSLPAELKIRSNEAPSDTPRFDLTFSSLSPGLHQGELTLSVSDTQGNRQPINLRYCAFVRRPPKGRGRD